MRKIAILLIVLVAVTVTEVFAESVTKEKPAVDNSVTITELEIGVMLCLSGNCADWGQAALEGAQLATDMVNAAGGVQGKLLKLQVEDTGEAISGAKAVTAFKKLQTSGSIKYFIGPSWSPGAKAILPLVKRSTDSLVITPSASAVEFKMAGDNIFNMRAAEEAGTRALAKYAFSKGWRKAAIFSSQQAADMTQGRAFEEEFKRLGGTVTIRLEPPPSLSDLRSEAARIIAGKPDVVFLINYNQMDSGARELSKQGYTGVRMAISLDAHRVKSSKGALDGVIVARSPEPSRAFRRAFEKRFGHAPGLSAEGGYDAVQALSRAMKQAGSLEVSKVKKALPQLEFAGASGDIRFDKHGGLVQNPMLFQVQGEQLVNLGIR